MRPIDIYRGADGLCTQFNPRFNPEYETALQEERKARKQLEVYDIPKEVIEKLEEAHDNRTSTEVELMGCFAFQQGMEFQRNLGTDPRHCDISILEE